MAFSVSDSCRTYALQLLLIICMQMLHMLHTLIRGPGRCTVRSQPTATHPCDALLHMRSPGDGIQQYRFAAPFWQCIVCVQPSTYHVMAWHASNCHCKNNCTSGVLGS
jgi:hypothetical protein